jgi:hypothetical protein
VPGTSEIADGETSKGARNLVIAMIYIFFGMANLVMCYDLMEEQLTEKLKMIAIQLGIIKEPEEEEVKKDEEKQNKELPPPSPIPEEQEPQDYEEDHESGKYNSYQKEDTNIDMRYNSREPTRIQVKSRENTDISAAHSNSKAKVQSREPTNFFPSPLS